MSVKVVDRKLSKAEFVNVSQELFVLALHCAKKFPKSITFYVTQDFVKFARDTFSKTKMANQVFLKDKESQIKRKGHLEDALDSLSAFEGLANVLLDAYYSCLTDHAWIEIGTLMKKARTLIKSVIESDFKRVSSGMVSL